MSTSYSRSIRRIDCHHHIFPASIEKEQTDEKIGWGFPKENMPWSPEISLRTMDALDIEMAILSYPTGHPAGKGSDVVRQCNQVLKDIRDKYPDRFGFFATCMGDLRDMKGKRVSP
jgi:6-methylsalicylate decarboxylase